MNELERRRRQREQIERAEHQLEVADKQMRTGNRRNVPPLEPTAEQLAVSPTQAITLNVEWIAAAMSHTRSEGYGAALSAFQPLVDYANQHPLGHRQAFDEAVTDPALRELLYTALDRI